MWFDCRPFCIEYFGLNVVIPFIFRFNLSISTCIHFYFASVLEHGIFSIVVFLIKENNVTQKNKIYKKKTTIDSGFMDYLLFMCCCTFIVPPTGILLYFSSFLDLLVLYVFVREIKLNED